jgi:predicted HTH transcriptional regulator
MVRKRGERNMPIDLKDYLALPEKTLKSNRELLDFMDSEKAYTTTDLQNFLKIQHPAALSKLKKLKANGYLELKISGKSHYWRKIKEWPEDDVKIASWGF